MSAATASAAATASVVATASTAVIVRGADAMKKKVAAAVAHQPARRPNNEHDVIWWWWWWRWWTPSVFPSAQDLPVFGRQRAEDRLQGRQAAAALHFRARQDRAEPHHGGVGQEAA